jgi:hypothetical protein
MVNMSINENRRLILMSLGCLAIHPLISRLPNLSGGSSGTSGILNYIKSGNGFKIAPVVWADLVKRSFKEEVTLALLKANRNRGSKRIAFLVSGGMDSEILVTEAHRMGIPFDAFNIGTYEKNPLQEAQLKKIEINLDIKINRITLNTPEYLPSVSSIIQASSFANPHHILMMSGMEKIGRDYFFILGEGDLNKIRNQLYSKSQIASPLFLTSTEFSGSSTVLYNFGEFAYSEWARARSFSGEFQFFRSTPELLVSALTDSRLIYNSRFVKTKEILKHYFPYLSSRPTFNTWNVEGREFKLIREQIISEVKNKTLRPVEMNYNSPLKLKWSFG